MSRELHGIEQGIHLLSENADTGVAILFGAVTPGSLGTFDDAAEQGSIYHRTNGETYYKKTAGTGEDKWVRSATTDDITALDFRSKALVLTAETEPGELGTIDFSSAQYSDDDAPDLAASDHALGDYILFGSGGTEVAYRVVGIAGDVVTYSKSTTHATYPVQALADADFFVVENYLPDSPDDQEAQALVQYRTAGGYIKVGDVNWDFATGINLSSGYTPGTGNPTTADTVESALEKIDGNVDSLTTTVGVAQGANDMGTFTGTIITDNSTAKVALQEIETDVVAIQTASGIAAEATHYGVFTGSIIPDNQTSKQVSQALETDLEALQTAVGISPEATEMGTYTGDILTNNQTAKVNIQELETAIEDVQTTVTATGVTTEVTLDSVVVDDVIACEWLVTCNLDGTPAQRKTFKLIAHHNGTVSADATDVDDVIFSKLKLGAAFNAVFSVDLSGATTSQVMRLRVSASAAISVKAIRSVINF